MSKLISILLMAITALLGFMGGAFAATRYWINPRQEFVKIEANAFTNLVDLNEIRKSNIDTVIQSKERALDADIVALGSMAKEGGKLGGEARQILLKISKYRSKVNYTPDPETQQWVSDALKLSAQQP